MPIKGDLTKKYLEDYPTYNVRRLARLLSEENKEIFPNDEDARSSIRYYKGKLGEHSRMVKTNKQFHNKNLPQDYYKKYYHDPYNLPDAHDSMTTLKPYKLDSKIDSILILPDIHIPFHDKTALVCALKYGEHRKVDAVLINGDLVDFYGVSSFVKTPNKVRIKDEIKMTNEFLVKLREIFPTQKIIWREGNHEERFERYLLRYAPELYDLDILQLDEIFELAECGVQYLKGRRSIKAGKLNIIHGHEFGGGGGVNPARALFLKAKCNCIEGHFHQDSEHVEKNMNGEIVGCWSTGCLCTLNAEYLPQEFNKWNHGFAIVNIDKSGDFEVENKKIINGVVK